MKWKYLCQTLEESFQEGIGFPSQVSNTATNFELSTEEFFTSMVIADLIGPIPSLVGLRESLANIVHGHYESEQGLFHFFKDRSSRLPPDIDCIAYGINAVLMPCYLTGSVRPSFAKAADAILSTADQLGVLQVYVVEPTDERYGRYDAAVCMNALYSLYALGYEHAPAVEATERFVLEWLQQGDWKNGTRYYPSVDIALYSVARAVSNFPKLLLKFTSTLKPILETRAQQPGNALELACRILSFIPFGLPVTQLRQNLVEQNHNGAFPALAFFKMGKQEVYFGSKALTSAFVLRAMSSSTRYKFSKSPTVQSLGEAQATCIQRVLQQLTQETLEFELDSRTYQAIVTYLCWCSPASATEGELEIATQFLCLFFLINDSKKIQQWHTAKRYEELSNVVVVLFGEQGRSDSLLDKLANRLALSCGNFEPLRRFPFLCEFKKWIEHSVLLDAQSVDLQTYDSLRAVDIAVPLWIALWSMLHWPHLPLSAHGFGLTCLVTHSARVVYLDNDSGSLAKDAQNGTPNWELLHQVAHNVPLQVSRYAASALRNWHWDKLLKISGTLLQSDNGQALTTFIEWLVQFPKGSAMVMLLQKNRYDAVDA